MRSLLCYALLIANVPLATAFFQGQGLALARQGGQQYSGRREEAGVRRAMVGKGKAVTNSPECEEAISLFTKYKGSRKSERYQVDEKTLAQTFENTAAVYGTENALKMVKSLPEVMIYNTEKYSATLDQFAETFGRDEAIEMVVRNPALAAIRPSGYGGADAAGSETMYMSYIVAATRPAGPFFLATLFAFLATPFIEQATGVPRGDFFSTLLSLGGGN